MSQTSAAAMTRLKILDGIRARRREETAAGACVPARFYGEGAACLTSMTRVFGREETPAPAQ